MLKTILRFLAVTLVAVALGFLIYYINQPAAGASGLSSFGDFSRELGGEGGFREGSFSLARGLFGIGGDLLLVAIITAVVVLIQKAFTPQHEPARIR